MSSIQALGSVLTSFDSLRVPIKSSERVNGPIPYLGASGTVDWVEGFTHEGSFLCVSEDGANLLSRSLPVAWVQEGKFWANNHVHVLGGVSRPHLKYFQYAIEQTNIASYVTGSAQPKLTKSALSRIEVPKFSIEKEIFIGSLLSSFDDKIATNEKFENLSVELLQTLWEEITATNKRVLVSEVFDLNPRTNLKSAEAYPFLEMKNLPDAGIVAKQWSYRNSKGGSKFKNGDVLLARITPCFENGKKALVDFLADGEVGTGSTEFIVFRPKPGVPSAAAFCVISTEDFRSEAAKMMTGTSGRQRIQPRALQEATISWPEPDRLSSFCEIAGTLMKKLTAIRDETIALTHTRDELLPQLMSGRITVGEASEALSEVVGEDAAASASEGGKEY